MKTPGESTPLPAGCDYSRALPSRKFSSRHATLREDVDLSGSTSGEEVGSHLHRAHSVANSPRRSRIRLDVNEGGPPRRFHVTYCDVSYIVDMSKKVDSNHQSAPFTLYKRHDSLTSSSAGLPPPSSCHPHRLASPSLATSLSLKTMPQHQRAPNITTPSTTAVAGDRGWMSTGNSDQKRPTTLVSRCNDVSRTEKTGENERSDSLTAFENDPTAAAIETLKKSKSMIQGSRQKAGYVAAVELLDDLKYRLRYILHQLNSGQLPLEDLKRNIEYAALVLETAYMDETRRICDEDDDLAEVTPDTVPDEVREWLAATFTRQTVQTRREKPKFKSVANAIRTGIFFDKLYKRTQTVMAPIPMELTPYLRNINNWDFNSFELNEVTDGHALKYVGFELFNRYGFLERFKINYQALENYLLSLETGYSKNNNPYHNCVHAADIAQTSHYFLSQTGLASSLSDLELMAVIFGSLIHDYEHTGHTNNFHIQSGSQFAMLYNDRSVLENHHVSACYRLMKEEDKNIFERLTRDEFRELRNMVIEIVLATDMSTHFVQIKTMKNMLTLPEGIDKMKAMCLIVHACDISHASKPWDLHSRWTEGVLEEFFRQGDLEASMGLPYSPLCDRHTVHVAESQIGFIDFIVEPTMVVCGEMLMKMVEPLVSLPSSDSLYPPNSIINNGGGRDGSMSGASHSPVSPIPDLKSPSGSNSVRRIPINYFGKLEIPNPWARHLQENKVQWRERAVREEVERNAEAINPTAEEHSDHE